MQLNRARVLVDLVRPYNLLPLLVAYAAGIFFAGLPKTSNLVAGFVIIFCLHTAATLQNDAEDTEIDKDNPRGSVLSAARLSKQHAKLVEIWLIVGGLLACYGTTWPRLALMFLVVSLCLSWIYNSPPLQLSRHPILSIVVLGTCYGILPLSFGLSIGGAHLSILSFCLIAGWAAIRFSTSLLKDYKDAAGDAKHHKVTFYLRYGPGWTAALSAALAAIGYLLAGAAVAAQYSPHGVGLITLGLLGLLAVIQFQLRLHLQAAQTNSKRTALAQSIFFAQSRLELLLVGWLWLS